jgi:two-component system phosphate regulon sensor histidine kinase PhoR
MHLDLDTLLTPALEPFAGSASTFALAIHDADGGPMRPPPPTVPDNFVPPGLERHGLQLHAYPANAERIIAAAHAAARNRTLLMLALFATALGGALWLWRSASRETELAALKIDLVSRVSHELKTPLALIRMYGETLGLGRARDPQQAAHFGGIITRESERLTALIQRILDFSRQQAGTLTYETGDVELGELLRTVCDTYTPHLEARGAILVETLPHGVHVRCDRNACESAIVNLLENAAKYGRDDEPEQEIELELCTEGDQAIVEVRDRGRGIPAAELESVFDGFHRAGNAGEVRGAGLGLSLVRHFARAHGGEIVARARAGGGTVLRLSLPCATSRGAPHGTKTTDRP